MRACLVAAAMGAASMLVCACAQGGGGVDAGAVRDTRPPPIDTRPPPDANRPRDTGTRDSGQPIDAGRVDAGMGMDAGSTPDAGMEVDAGPACLIRENSLVIVEVMVSSRSGAGDRGEWFEVFNTEACTIRLTGIVIESPTSAGVPRTHTVATGVVPPGGRHVFALSAAPAANHGLTFDYAYGGGGSGDVILNNGMDTLMLRSGATVIDQVTWPSTGYTHGAARQFPSNLALVDNDDWGEWCDATEVYSMAAGGPYHGTPKAPNGTCP